MAVLIFFVRLVFILDLTLEKCELKSKENKFILLFVKKNLFTRQLLEKLKILHVNRSGE